MHKLGTKWNYTQEGSIGCICKVFVMEEVSNVCGIQTCNYGVCYICIQWTSDPTNQVATHKKLSGSGR